MQKVAQNWLVLTIGGSPFCLGLDAFVGELPILLLTLVGGVIADRHDRRYLLIGSQPVQLTCAFMLAALVYCVAETCPSGTCWRCRSAPASPRRSAARPTSRCCRRSCRAGPPQRHRAQLDPVQPVAHPRPADRRRDAGRRRHGRLLPAQRAVVLRRDRARSSLLRLDRIRAQRPPARSPTRCGPASPTCRQRPALIELTALGFLITFLAFPLQTLLPVMAKDVFGQGVDGYSRDDLLRRRRGDRAPHRRLARQRAAHGPPRAGPGHAGRACC